MEKSKKKEGLSRLFEIAGQKKRLAYIGRSAVRRKCGMYACALLGGL